MNEAEYKQFKQERIEHALPKPVPLVGVDFGQAKDYTAVVVVERYYTPASNLYVCGHAQGTVLAGCEVSLRGAAH